MDSARDWTVTPLTPDLLRGALDLERTAHGLLPHRLPARARAQCADGQLAMAESQPSGVRLVFRTRATAVELDTLRTKTAYQGVPTGPDGVYDLLVDGRLAGRASVTGGNVLMVDMTTWSVENRPGPVGTVRFTGLPDREKDVEIWLPYNEKTHLVALRTDAPVEPVPDRGRKVWLHHGSSISHGSFAASPTTTWPALAAALGGVELINLGLGGNALLDPFTARTLRDTPADLLSVKIGINLVNADVMRLRAFGPAVHGFLDTVREGHPTTPLLVVSPSCARCTRTPRDPVSWTSPLSARGNWSSASSATPPNRPRASSRSTSSVTNWPASSDNARPTTPTSTTSTAANSTASRTSPNCPCPTGSTRTPRHTAASPNASPRWPSARTDRSAPGRERRRRSGRGPVRSLGCAAAQGSSTRRRPG